MAQDYVILNESDNGRVAINKSVIKAIGQISIDDIANAVRMPENKFSRPLVIRIDENELYIEADIKVKYGANVKATCELVQNKIYENVLFMTGLKPAGVSVNVTGFEAA